MSCLWLPLSNESPVTMTKTNHMKVEDIYSVSSNKKSLLFSELSESKWIFLLLFSHLFLMLLGSPNMSKWRAHAWKLRLRQCPQLFVLLLKNKYSEQTKWQICGKSFWCSNHQKSTMWIAIITPKPIFSTYMDTGWPEIPNCHCIPNNFIAHLEIIHYLLYGWFWWSLQNEKWLSIKILPLWLAWLLN